MDTSENANVSPSSPTSSNLSTFGIQFTPLRFFQSPVSTLLEYSGLFTVRPDNPETDPLVADDTVTNDAESSSDVGGGNSSSGEVSIRIIGAGENQGIGDEYEDDGEEGGSVEERGSGVEASSTVPDDDAGNASRDSSYQRFDIQQVARWIEQILPFSLLLLFVFIRQHLQGFFVTIWITAVMFKSNDILRKQTALKGERKTDVLVGYFVVFVIHVIGIYWWYHNDDLFYPLLMVPPKVIPPFWHAIFIILVNDTMVRQAAMALKLVLLMYYKNGRGHNFRRQGQILTLVEYMLLLYRALLPTPVWYRFFLNKEYGSLFSSLTTGLYLTFKLTSIVEKVKSFYTALKALSKKEVHYGSHATPEQVNAAGDLCAICQEKMHAPILLRCKHLFCEDCVSEWFERERTCPLCRALVRPADLRSFGDGSTSLFFQLF
ncbi:RING finger and transmembrane domain-containing protein 1-like [Solanum tuberosum]|uniref:RING finger and transmembrane domain-containing protein 1-like n=1 Tax=Solanum tuberosum TaxID=4113 RepID=UPI0003D25E79|nr:PREDICTED: RING finger and transmembrane domain-containing protein 1-like [Solanum tuberosum]